MAKRAREEPAAAARAPEADARTPDSVSEIDVAQRPAGHEEARLSRRLILRNQGGSQVTESDGLHYFDFDSGEFRYAVARYIRLLIRARWKCEPGFLPGADLAQWELSTMPRISAGRW